MNQNSIKPQTRLAIAYTELFLTSASWALGTILIKLYVKDVPPFHLLFGRFFVAMLFLLALRPQTLKKATTKSFKVGSVLGLFSFLSYGFGVMGLVYTTASKSGFFVAMAVLFVPLSETVLKKRLPNRWLVLSITLSMVGLYLISGMDGGGINLGDILSLLCSVAYTVYILILDRFGKSEDTMVLTQIQLIFVSFLAFLVVLIFEGFSVGLLLSVWMPLLIMGILSTGMTTLLQARGQRYASPESVGIIFLGEPLFTFLMALAIIGERTSWIGVLGAGLLLFAMVLAVLKKV